MRLFTAIELPDAAREHLQRVRTKLMKAPAFEGVVSWVKPENLHITLKFLGEVPEGNVEPLTEALSRVTVQPMQLFAERLLFFPKRGPLRVIGAGIGGEVEKLADVFEQIEDACHAAGFEREVRRYTPHVTFGRARKARHGGGLRTVREVDVGRAFPGPTFLIEQFVLVQSQLSPKGSTYTVAARFQS
jgi:RNA 2',3'-cyclic 3'-phosphodiesterase